MIKKTAVLVIFLLIILFSFLLTPLFIRYFNVPPLGEPKPFSYTNDELSFLKIYYLMKDGNNFYQSFAIARSSFSNGGIISQDVFTWRSPAIFFIWQMTAINGDWILTEFLICIVLLLASVFLLLKKTTNSFISILGVSLMLPYIFDTFKYKTSFLFTEWWGLFFFLYGLTSILYKHQKLGFFLLLLSLLTRELFIIPIFGIFLFSLFTRNNWKFFLILLILAGFYYVLHSIFVTSFLHGSSPHYTFLSRFHFPHVINIQSMLSFSMRPFVFYGQKTHFLIEGLGLTGILIGTLRKRVKARCYILITIFSFLFTLPFISVKENDYWGIVFVPLILMSIPLSLEVIKFKK